MPTFKRPLLDVTLLAVVPTHVAALASLGLVLKSLKQLPPQRKKSLLLPETWRSRLKDLQTVLEQHVKPCCAPALLLLLTDRKQLVTLARHELKRPALRKTHLHRLKELEVPRKFPLAHRLHRWLHLLPAAHKVPRSFDSLSERD